MISASRIAVTAVATTLLAACGPTAEVDLSRMVDHHVHLLSPGLVADWKSTGVSFSRADSFYTSAGPLLDESAGRRPLTGAVLLPMAHLYGSASFRQSLRLGLAAERAAVQRENDHVAAEAARYPGRALAFCGVDFLRPYAWDELRRCRTELNSPGIKLHLGSARANLRNSGHLATLAGIVAWARAESLVVMLHFDPQSREASQADVERFIAQVLEPRADLVMVIAHLGGSGGYGPWTRVVYRTLAEWLETEAAAGRPRAGIYFDISAAWLAQDSDEVPRSTRQDGEALAADIAAHGVARLLFGSDSPVFDPGPYGAAFKRATGLTQAAWDSLAANRVPGFP
jgi:predicted TIM-barrel fold metal-dependent hydrolase